MTSTSRRPVFFGLFVLAIAWFYLWRPAAFHSTWLSAKPEGIYNELSEAFLSGDVSLKRLPDPRLVALPNPYDPDANAAFRVSDLSYYKGRYFAYMGPAPAVMVFMPVRLLTGKFLDQRVASTFLGIIGVAASVALISGLRRRFMPQAPPSILLIASLALALADGYYVATRGGLAQHVSVASAYAFSMISLWACGKAADPGSGGRGWLAAASAALGAAIASRPNYVFASIALLPPLVLWMRAHAPGKPRDRLKAVVAALAPLAVIVALLLAYNWVRFGDFLDFGQRYILGGWNQIRMPSAGLANAWENTRRYLFAPAHYSATFPFVIAPSWFAVSLLRHVPWLWLIPVAAWALARSRAPSPVRALGASAFLLAAANLTTLIFLPSGNPALIATSANARYLLDFQPGLTLFVAVGVLAACAPSPSVSPVGRQILIAVAGCLALASILIALSLDLGPFPTGSYRALAHVLDLPAYGLEAARGESYGPLEIEITLPRGKTGAFEPIVSTGTAEGCDLLYVNYVSPTQVSFGLVTTDLRGPMSAPVTVSYDTPHRLRVGMGSLYPPSGHPRWSTLDEPQVAFLSRELRVELDGAVALKTQAHFHAAAPAQVLLGRNDFLPGYSSPSFSGTILSSKRLPIAAPPLSELKEPSYGAVLMQVSFPADPPIGFREPLVVTGVSSAGDIVYVHYIARDQIRFGIDHWGGAGAETGPLHVAPATPHSIEISMGSLLPADSERAQPPHLRVVLDGSVVLDVEQSTYDSSPYDVTIGVNAIGGSTCGAAFTGQILKIGRASP